MSGHISEFMQERYSKMGDKHKRSLQKALDFYAVYEYARSAHNVATEFLHEVFLWATTDYDLNKFVASLDIEPNINGKKAIQLNSNNVDLFLEALQVQYPKQTSNAKMKLRLASLSRDYMTMERGLSKQTELSLSSVASALTKAGIPYRFVKASPDFVLDDLDQAISGMKAEVSKLVKAKDGAVSGRYRNTISKTAEYIKKACYALSRSEYSEDDLPKLQAYSKSFNTMAQALFSQPSLAQLSDHKNGRYYTKMSMFRASSRQDAKRIADAETMMEAFMFITDAAMNLVVRDTELLSMSQDFDL